MMARKDRIRQIVKASLAGLAQVALPLGLRVIVSFLGNIKTITMSTIDPGWPA
jgi:hypothetical protein